MRNRFTMTQGQNVRAPSTRAGVNAAPGEDPYDLDLKEVARQRAKEMNRAKLQQNVDTQVAAKKEREASLLDPNKPLPDDLDDLTRTRYEQARERNARTSELDAEKARALQSGAARSGLAGMGLSGASSALQSDIGRQQDRSRTLALADLERGFRGETRQVEDRERQRQFQDEDREFLDISRDLALWDLEDMYETDRDGDGFQGDPASGITAEQAGKNKQSDNAKADRDEVRAGFESLDHTFGDKDTDPGTKQEPFHISNGQQMALLLARGIKLTEVPDSDGFYRDQDGNYYVLGPGRA